MDAISVLLLAAIGATFLFSGVRKVGDLRRFTVALTDLGVPAALAPIGAIVVVAGELIIGVLVFALGNRPWLMWTVLAVLGAFTVVLVVARRHAVPCACFSAAEDDEPPTWRAFARNAGLAAGALLLAFAPDITIPSWLGTLTSTELVLLVFALFALVAATFGLLAAHGTLVQQEEILDEVNRLRAGDPQRPSWHGQGLPVGSPAPMLDLTSVSTGEVVPLADDRDERDPRAKLLIFAGSDCAACRELAGDVGTWATLAASTVAVVEVFRTGTQVGLPGAEYQVEDRTGEVFVRFQARRTPSAVLVDRHGRIESSCARGREAIDELVTTISERVGIA